MPTRPTPSPRTPGVALVAPLLLALVAVSFGACEVTPGDGDGAAADSSDTPFIHAANDTTAGRYLVEIAGCNDCHTPGFMQDANVPEATWLTGVPIGFRGPWGTSYPKNLRLTVQSMDEETWVETLQTRHALPPMPWPSVNAMSEQDIRALYTFIRSLGPAGQPAPEAVPPGQEPTTPYFDFVPQHMERMGAPPAGPPPAPAPDTAAAPDSGLAAPAPAGDSAGAAPATR